MQSPALTVVPGVRSLPSPELSLPVPGRTQRCVRGAPLLFRSRAGRPRPLISASPSTPESGLPVQVPGARASTNGSGGGAVAKVGRKRGRVHFVGVGGTGISALALLALEQGFEVSGSDIVWNYSMDRLHKAGAKLYMGHLISNIYCNEDSNLPHAVVFSSAIPADNVEVLYAKSIGIPVYKRGAWLGEITKESTLVAVSGTHGKSTTTAMLSYVLHCMEKDITAVIGAEVPQLPERNIISGSGSIFVLEQADEYDGCFLGVSPYVAVVTSLEWEHVDIFQDEEAVKNMFRKFLHHIREGGYLILCGDSAGARALLDNSQQGSIFNAKMMSSSELTNPCYHIVTYGTSPVNDWHASSITPNEHGGQDYVLYHRKHPVAEVSLRLPGLHNVLNSLAVIATITSLNIQLPDIVNQVKHHLSNFEGLSRRFEFVGKVDHCFIFHDFAHHPTEVRAVLQAARQRFPCQEIWVVFQPHSFSRLSALMKGFSTAFSDANHVIVTEIYAGREINTINISSRDLAMLIDGPSSEYIPKMEDVLQKLIIMLSSRTSEETVLLVIGASSDDITKLGQMLFDRLQETS